MKTYIRIFTVFMAMAVVATGCGIKPSLRQIKTGLIQTTEISIPLPSNSKADVKLTLEFVAGELTIAPGAKDKLVSGKATFNSEELKPYTEISQGSYILRPGNQKYDTFPVFDKTVTNFWDLKLANIPMNLKIQAGAYNGKVELGGLSLKTLDISEGGSDFVGTFSEPNPVEMSSFTYNTGGSKMVLRGLANANFAQMSFMSGAGDYSLSFDGLLKRDAKVTIESGASTVTIIVPKNTNALVTFDGGLTSINNDGWSQNGNTYSIHGSGPTITMLIKLGLGTLNLKAE